jgi:hypothetical protein
VEEAMDWIKLTDAVSSLPPQRQWILLALPREGGVVVEGCYDGFGNGSHKFHLRDGMSLYASEYNGRVTAWSRMPKYPKELES